MERAAASYHVVLIGIDVYSGGVYPLRGCVNDIDEIQELLLNRLGVPADRIKRFAAPLRGGPPRPTTVPTQRPTRANLIAALTALGDEVKPGDRVFIYHSGHGTRSEVIDPRDNGRYYREALLATDSNVAEGERLVFDWELNRLLGKIAERTPAVTVVLDCCFSAGATRAAPEKGARPRYVKSPRPIVLRPEIAPPPATGERGAARRLGVGSGDFMVVAACLDDERARESDGSGGGPPAPGRQQKTHGLLTRALVEQLSALEDTTLSELRWGQIWRTVAARVEAMNAYQHPWLSSNPVRRVFGGPPEAGDIGYSVTFDAASATYRLNAGSLVGVTEGAVVALYPELGSPGAAAVFPPVGTPEDLRERIGLVRVISTGRATSDAKADPAMPPPSSPPSAVLRGRLIRPGVGAKLVVALAPYDEAMANRLAASPFLEIAKAGDKGQITLVQRSDKAWAITDDIYGTGEEPGPPVPTLPFLANTAPAAGAADIAVALVEHYYLYAAPLRIARNCTDLADCLEMRLLDCNEQRGVLPPELVHNPPLPELQPAKQPNYEVKAGRFDAVNDRWIALGDCYCIQIENTSDIDLWLTLVNCDSEGRVNIHASRYPIARKSRKTFWSSSGVLGDPMCATLSAGQSLGVDRFVAIATTNNTASLDYLKRDTSFAEIASGVGERGEHPRGASERWTAAVVVVRMTAT
ncbi:caspase family protein [Sorangium sp. So ce426]|uniref:caspase family protein n=1 Tax=Sorangium sp. So ce426 TaxID=3133312 RepID=UPI003F5BAA97